MIFGNATLGRKDMLVLIMSFSLRVMKKTNHKKRARAHTTSRMYVL